MPKKYIIVGIILAAYALIPAVAPENIVHLMAITGIWIIIASGLNLLTGYMGYVSFGHAGFVGLGAYISVLLFRHLDFSFWAVAVVTPVLMALIGVFLGTVLLRLSGIYFSIGTLLVGEILYSTFYNWSKVTGGYMGLNVPPISLQIPGLLDFDFELIHWYCLIHLSLLLVTGLMAFLVRSQFGKELIAIKENESLAESLGVDVQARKRQCFALACMLAGFGGVLFAFYIRHIDPGSFAIGASAEFLTIVIIGGLASIAGPFLGSYLLKTLTLYLGALGPWRMVVYGVIIVLVMLYARGGIAGFGHYVLHREKKK